MDFSTKCLITLFITICLSIATVNSDSALFKKACAFNIYQTFDQLKKNRELMQHAILNLSDYTEMLRHPKSYYKYMFQFFLPGKIQEPSTFCSNFIFDDELIIGCIDQLKLFGDTLHDVMENAYFTYTANNVKSIEQNGFKNHAYNYMIHISEFFAINKDMKYPSSYCHNIYDYTFDKPGDYTEPVYIPHGIYFTDADKKLYNYTKRLKKKEKYSNEKP